MKDPTHVDDLHAHQPFCRSVIIHNTHAVRLAASARARWKIESENNNTLKTKGAPSTHGHGVY